MAESVHTKVPAILASLLVVEKVTLDDDFFMLGGDSLAATVLMAALEQIYDVVIDPVEIFERPHIGEFCRWLETAMQAPEHREPDRDNAT